MALDSFQTNLIVLAGQHQEVELLKQMGYGKPKEQTLERLRNTLQSPHMGLDKAQYDFKFDQLGFVRALCDALEIDRAEVDQHIAERKAWLDKVAKAFKPFVWVDTEFKRKSEPIFVLAALEQHRHIRFPDTFHLYSIETQLDLAGERAALYYEQTEGTLLYWGGYKTVSVLCG